MLLPRQVDEVIHDGAGFKDRRRDEVHRRYWRGLSRRDEGVGPCRTVEPVKLDSRVDGGRGGRGRGSRGDEEGRGRGLAQLGDARAHLPGAPGNEYSAAW